MKLAFLLTVVAAAGTGAACQQQTQASGLPKWLTAMVAQLPSSGTIVEEAVYQGRRTFLVMPSDRAPDSGNEHILYSEDGKVICEFGGIGGHVTVGSCDLEAIKYVRKFVITPLGFLMDVTDGCIFAIEAELNVATVPSRSVRT